MSASGVVSDAPAKDVVTAVQWIGKDFPISKDFSFQRGIERLRHSVISAGTYGPDPRIVDTEDLIRKQISG